MSQPADLTRSADSNPTAWRGPTRTRRPIYEDILPPCNNACPAGENIQAWLAHAQEGRFREAWETILQDNPLPAVHGRVCYHPCEDSCNRKNLDGTISIHAVERFLGDMAIDRGLDADASTPSRRASGSWSSAPAPAACPPPTT